MNSDIIQNKDVKICTHDGKFHADELLACAMLKQLPEYRNAEIIRTRDNSIISKCDIVVDVGAIYDPKSNRYDHHQREFNLTFKDFFPESKWDIKLSSAGLVYIHFGMKIISTLINRSINDDYVKAVFEKLYSNFIVEIDAIDNGITSHEGSLKYQINTSLSSRVGLMNPLWNEDDQDEMALFQKALIFVEDEFLLFVKHYNSWYAARDNVINAIKDRYNCHASGSVICINRWCPWAGHLLELENSTEEKFEGHVKTGNIMFCIYQRNDNTWSVQGVPVSGNDSFKIRLALPERWRGLRDKDLCTASGISGCVFVHANGHLGINATYEGIMKMVDAALNNSEHT